VIDEKSI